MKFSAQWHVNGTSPPKHTFLPAGIGSGSDGRFDKLQVMASVEVDGGGVGVGVSNVIYIKSKQRHGL